jgi:hypothetical protein
MNEERQITTEVRDSCPVCGMGCIAKFDSEDGIKLEFKEWVHKEIYLTREDAEFLRIFKQFIEKKSLAK